jgi:hypothetical protein
MSVRLLCGPGQDLAVGTGALIEARIRKNAAAVKAHMNCGLRVGPLLSPKVTDVT